MGETVVLDIALLAPTKVQAEHLLARIRQVGNIEHARFFALGMDESWPEKYFHEVHWLPNGNVALPRQSLASLAAIVHIHQCRLPHRELHSGFRHYIWDSSEQMAGFWASLYRARGNPAIPGLDWNSYTNWSPGLRVGRSLHAHGTNLAEAVESLSARLHDNPCRAAVQALLIIEAGCPVTFGGYVDALERLGRVTGAEVIPTGWQEVQGSGCGLWLSWFEPSIERTFERIN